MARTDTVFISWHLVAAATRSPDTQFLFNYFSSLRIREALCSQAVAMSDSNDIVAVSDSDVVDVTGPSEPAKKVPKLITGFFQKFDPNDSAQVARKADQDRKESERFRLRTEEARAKQLKQGEDKLRAEADRKQKARAAERAAFEAAKAAEQAAEPNLQQAAELQQVGTSGELLLTCVLCGACSV